MIGKMEVLVLFWIGFMNYVVRSIVAYADTAREL